MHLYSWKPDFTPDTVAVPHFIRTIPPPPAPNQLKSNSMLSQMGNKKSEDENSQANSCHYH